MSQPRAHLAIAATVAGVPLAAANLPASGNQTPPDPQPGANRAGHKMLLSEAQQASRRPADQTESRPRVLVRDLRACDEQRPARRRYLGPPAMPYCWPYLYGYGNDPYPLWRRLADAYRAYRYLERKERERRFNRRDMAARRQRLLDRHEHALTLGLEHLKAGDPARAVVALTLAAKLNQGDPACRIHLAQARLALQHYREAALALRRALELQPKLVYIDLHLGDYYHRADALDRYAATLARWAQAHESPPEVHFLLGFVEFQRGDFAAAHVAFQRVARAWPDDALTRDYLEITKPGPADSTTSR